MNIYVSNLSFNTSDIVLKALFATFGKVASAKVITDKDSGRSCGFRFVEMRSDGAGKEAIKGLISKEAEGRAIPVSKARDKPKCDSGDITVTVESNPATKDGESFFVKSS